jgi:hypothetical protein
MRNDRFFIFEVKAAVVKANNPIDTEESGSGGGGGGGGCFLNLLSK